MNNKELKNGAKVLLVLGGLKVNINLNKNKKNGIRNIKSWRQSKIY